MREQDGVNKFKESRFLDETSFEGFVNAGLKAKFAAEMFQKFVNSYDRTLLFEFHTPFGNAEVYGSARLWKVKV